MRPTANSIFSATNHVTSQLVFINPIFVVQILKPANQPSQGGLFFIQINLLPLPLLLHRDKCYVGEVFITHVHHQPTWIHNFLYYNLFNTTLFWFRKQLPCGASHGFFQKVSDQNFFLLLNHKVAYLYFRPYHQKHF